MMIETIAVIISTYNTPQMLRLVLDGYARQSEDNFHLYIADDGSSDETKTVIDQFRMKTSIAVDHVWHEDRGFRKTRIHNRTLRQVTEPYILLTDGDCIPLPNMIATHRKVAQHKCLISGSRILLSQTFSEQLINLEKTLHFTSVDWITHRIHGDINRLLPLLFPPFTSNPHANLQSIRGCHLACWRSDIEHINGFDESYEGWGREDSDFVGRLLHTGVQRIDLRGMPVLHLWHPEASRKQLANNHSQLQMSLREKRVRALKGMAEG